MSICKEKKLIKIINISLAASPTYDWDSCDLEFSKICIILILRFSFFFFFVIYYYSASVFPYSPHYIGKLTTWISIHLEHMLPKIKNSNIKTDWHVQEASRLLQIYVHFLLYYKVKNMSPNTFGSYITQRLKRLISILYPGTESFKSARNLRAFPIVLQN